MIRFLQTPGPIKKIVLGGLLTVVCVLMAITLIPGFGSLNLLPNSSGPGVVATVSGQDVTTNDVERQAKQMLNQQFPSGGAQASALLPFFAQRAAEILSTRKCLLAEAQRMGLKATDEDLREYMRQGPIRRFFCQMALYWTDRIRKLRRQQQPYRAAVRATGKGRHLAEQVARPGLLQRHRDRCRGTQAL